ncbi:MAG: electron transfer flavoprotein beta subunit/FixA family protein [Candidatus Bipolaricaulia bacterium]
MNVLVCVKRVPDTGARFELTDDERDIDTRNLEFTVSPHEECAVEEAIRIAEAHDGESTALTLGPEDASEQLRESLAKGVDRAVLLETDDPDAWDPAGTAQAISEAIQAQIEANGPFDAVLFGNEAADTGDFQVGIRVAEALGLPCVAGVKQLELTDGSARALRETSGGWDAFDVGLPAVFTVREGINVPRHPSLRGIMTAKKKEIERVQPEGPSPGLRLKRLRKPEERSGSVEVLGEGAEAAPRVAEILNELGVTSG